jgi:GNAT superfamily N-acetyltransferase
MDIRQANVTDVFELSRLWSFLLKESEPGYKPNLEMWRRYMCGMMSFKGYFCFVAEEDNKIIGFIDFAMQPEPGKGVWMAVINYFYVLPEHRGEVSGKLWEKAIESAKQNNAAEFFSFCFADKLDFWKNHGFKEEGFIIRRVI